MLDNGKFCGLDVHFTVEDAGDYVVKLSQQQYDQFLSFRAKGDAANDVFSVTVDPSKLGSPSLEFRTSVSAQFTASSKFNFVSRRLAKI